jgi:hypothetical protein
MDTVGTASTALINNLTNKLPGFFPAKKLLVIRIAELPQWRQLHRTNPLLA